MLMQRLLQTKALIPTREPRRAAGSRSSWSGKPSSARGAGDDTPGLSPEAPRAAGADLTAEVGWTGQEMDALFYDLDRERSGAIQYAHLTMALTHGLSCSWGKKPSSNSSKPSRLEPRQPKKQLPFLRSFPPNPRHGREPVNSARGGAPGGDAPGGGVPGGGARGVIPALELPENVFPLHSYTSTSLDDLEHAEAEWHRHLVVSCEDEEDALNLARRRAKIRRPMAAAPLVDDSAAAATAAADEDAPAAEDDAAAAGDAAAVPVEDDAVAGFDPADSADEEAEQEADDAPAADTEVGLP